MNKVDKTKTLILVEGLMLVLGLTFHIYSVIKIADILDANQSLSNVIIIIVPVLIYLVVAFYSFKGYSMPHGNLLRNIIFVFGLSIALLSCKIEDTACEYILPIAAVLATFISGHLGKKNRNILSMLIVLFLLLAQIEVSNDTNLFIAANLVIQWFVIMISYLSRYDEHKLAGKND